MAEEIENFYVKFKINTERGVLENFTFDIKEEDLFAWDGEEKRKNKEKDKETEPKSKSKDPDFSSSIKNFERMMDSFHVSAPFLMNLLPRQLDAVSDHLIRDFVKDHGTLKTGGEFEVYEVPIEYFHEFHQKFERMYAVHRGAAAMPIMFFMGLVSSYDAFLSGIIRIMLINKAEILSSSERNISFKDLVDAGSVETIRNRIMEKEIETVMRRNHSEQIEYLEDKLGISLRKDLKIWPEFMEIFERRNLFAHTSGVVSNQYINAGKIHGFDTSKIDVGERLDVSSKYYMRSVSVITEFGIKLSQVLWRKLLPNQINDAATELNETVFRLLGKERYKLADIIAQFGLSEMKKQGKDSTKKMLIVNHAIAVKNLDKKEEANRILDKEDWTASSLKFQICVAAVRDDMSEVLRLLQPVLESKAVDKNSFRTWPAFATMRDNPEFRLEYRKIAGEKLFSSEEVTEAKEEVQEVIPPSESLGASVDEDHLASVSGREEESKDGKANLH